MARQQPRKMHAIEDLAINLLEAHVDAADTQTFVSHDFVAKLCIDRMF